MHLQRQPSFSRYWKVTKQHCFPPSSPKLQYRYMHLSPIYCNPPPQTQILLVVNNNRCRQVAPRHGVANPNFACNHTLRYRALEAINLPQKIILSLIPFLLHILPLHFPHITVFTHLKHECLVFYIQFINIFRIRRKTIRFRF